VRGRDCRRRSGDSRQSFAAIFRAARHPVVLPADHVLDVETQLLADHFLVLSTTTVKLGLPSRINLADARYFGQGLKFVQAVLQPLGTAAFLGQSLFDVLHVLQLSAGKF